MRSAQLVAAPEGYDSKLPWVGVQVDRTEPGLDETEAIWLAGLVQGAVADRMRADQGRTADVVGGGLLINDGADGTQPAMDLGTGSIAGGQAFHSPEDEVLTGRARAAAATFAITLASVSVLHPLESALSAAFVVPDDLEPTWTIDDLRAALEGASGDVEGTYVKLLAPDGSTLLSAGTSYRTGEGGLSFADGQDRRFGAVHGAFGADRGNADGTDGH